MRAAMLRGMTFGTMTPDPESGTGAVTSCPVQGCHQLMLVRYARAHHDWHESQHEWEEGVDKALDGGATGLELVPFPTFDATTAADEPGPSL